MNKPHINQRISEPWHLLTLSVLQRWQLPNSRLANSRSRRCVNSGERLYRCPLLTNLSAHRLESIYQVSRFVLLTAQKKTRSSSVSMLQACHRHPLFAWKQECQCVSRVILLQLPVHCRHKQQGLRLIGDGELDGSTCPFGNLGCKSQSKRNPRFLRSVVDPP